jgi:hypothetical protein
MIVRTRFFGQAVRWFLWTVLLTGLLSACAQPTLPDSSPSVAAVISPTAADTGPEQSSPEPAQPAQAVFTQTSQALDACLIGDWIVADLQRSVTEAYARTQAQLALVAIEGETRYTFRPDGSLEIRFDNLATTLSGTIDGKDIQARNLMVGTATAEYHLNVDTREIVFSNFGGEGIQFATEINGQVLAQGDFPAWRAFTSNLIGGSPANPTAGPTRVVDESYAVVTCAGDEMHLQAIDPVPGPDVLLKRTN